MESDLPQIPDHPVPPRAVERAVRLSYAQAMLSAVYVAMTGGMFIIGYALKLGATNAQIGLMGTVPMFAVAVQLLSSMLVERGISRRKLTILASTISVCGWLLIILLPYATTEYSKNFKIGALIGLITILTAFAYVAGNARSSWVGDLIPPGRRGAFFGRVTTFGGLIGAICAIAAGHYLDGAKDMDLPAFGIIFACAMAVGLGVTILYWPQADVQVKPHELASSPVRMVRETLRNKALMLVMAYALLWSMQAIAAPFYPAYLLRDLKMPYVGLAILNTAATLTVLVSAPFWGRVVDRYGCRPVLIACTTFLAPTQLIWIWVSSPQMAYALICPLNFIGGFATGGITIALTTLVYKVTPDAGRSVQFAIYGIIVTLFAAPMPAIGGHLPGWLKSVGLNADLRCTFYATVLFMSGAAIVSRYIHEPDAKHAKELVSKLPGHIRRPRTLEHV